MNYLYSALGWVMNLCYGVCHNYGLAIILFTFLTKIILLPVSLWTYFNSITMLKIRIRQPHPQLAMEEKTW